MIQPPGSARVCPCCPAKTAEAIREAKGTVHSCFASGTMVQLFYTIGANGFVYVSYREPFGEKQTMFRIRDPPLRIAHRAASSALRLLEFEVF